jgi:hypothetical protein
VREGFRIALASADTFRQGLTSRFEAAFGHEPAVADCLDGVLAGIRGAAGVAAAFGQGLLVGVDSASRPAGIVPVVQQEGEAFPAHDAWRVQQP